MERESVTASGSSSFSAHLAAKLSGFEPHSKRFLGERPGVTVLPRPCEALAPAQSRAAMAGLKPRLVLARHGGLILPAGMAAGALAEVRCPMFIVH